MWRPSPQSRFAAIWDAGSELEWAGVATARARVACEAQGSVVPTYGCRSRD